MSGPAPSSEPLDVRRRKLRYRATHRGTRELDLVLGGYVTRHVDTMGSRELDELERIVDIPDVDLAAWLSGMSPVPEVHKSDLLTKILTVSCTPADYT